MTRPTIDLNLVYTFHHLWRLRGVSLAAEAMGISQPALSGALSRLRDHFNDPLFLWNGKTMVPTARAEALAPLIRTILDDLERLDSPDIEGLSGISRALTIAASDYLIAEVAGKLHTALKATAPKVQANFIPTSHEVHSPKGRGGINLILIPDRAIEDLGFMRRRIYKDRYIVAASRRFFQGQESLSEADFFETEHIVFTLSPGVLLNHYMRPESSLGSRIQWTYTYSSFGIILQMIAKADVPLLAIVPERALRYSPVRDQLKAFESPIPMPEYEMGMYWSPSETDDPVHRWLRETLVGMLEAG